MQKLFHQSRSYYPLSNSQKNLKCLNNTEIERNAVNSASVTGTASPHRHFWCKGEKRRSHKKARAAGDAQGRWRRQQAGAVISLTSRWHPCPSCGSFQHGSKKKKAAAGRSEWGSGGAGGTCEYSLTLFMDTQSVCQNCDHSNSAVPRSHNFPPEVFNQWTERKLPGFWISVLSFAKDFVYK